MILVYASGYNFSPSPSAIPAFSPDGDAASTPVSQGWSTIQSGSPTPVSPQNGKVPLFSILKAFGFVLHFGAVFIQGHSFNLHKHHHLRSILLLRLLTKKLTILCHLLHQA